MPGSTLNFETLDESSRNGTCHLRGPECNLITGGNFTCCLAANQLPLRMALNPVSGRFDTARILIKTMITIVVSHNNKHINTQILHVLRII